MKRIDGAGATVDNLWTEGDPQTAVPATTVTGDYMNVVQEEVANVIEGAGDTIDQSHPFAGSPPNDTTQLLKAIKKLVASQSAWVSVDSPLFGATGDGTTDDSVAIQAACTSLASTGGTVFFPPGTYKINTTINVANGVSLVGAGCYGGAAILLYTGSTPGHKMVSYAGAARVAVQNLQFQCNTVGLQMVQLYMGDPVYFDISDCVFGGPVHGNAFTAIKLEVLSAGQIPPRGYGSIRNIIMSTLESFADSYTVGMRGIVLDGTVDSFTSIALDGQFDLEGCEIAIEWINVACSTIQGAVQIDGSGTAAAAALKLTGCQGNTFTGLKLGATGQKSFLLAQGGTFPTAFVGGETLVLGVDAAINFTTTFTSGDQTLAQVVSRINTAAGFAMAFATVVGQLKLVSNSSTDTISQVRVVSGSSGVLAKLGLSAATYPIPAQVKQDASSLDNKFIGPVFLQPHEFSLAFSDGASASARTTVIGSGDSSIGCLLPGPVFLGKGTAAYNTYTPVYSATGASGLAYTYRRGTYWQVGNVVFFAVDIIMTTSSSFGTGQVQLSLPISGAVILPQIVFNCTVVNYTGGSSGVIVQPIWAPGSPGVVSLFLNDTSAGTVAAFNGTHVQATTNFIMSGFYFI